MEDRYKGPEMNRKKNLKKRWDATGDQNIQKVIVAGDLQKIVE